MKPTPAKRWRQRGAAMLESIVVISTMLIFLGLIVWTRQAYGMKLDMQQATRGDTLYFASHGCTGSAPNTRVGEGGTVPGSGSPAGNAASKSGLQEAAAVDRRWNNASGSMTNTVRWSAVWDKNANGGNAPISYEKRELVANVSAASSVTCNEKKYDSQLTAWFKFGLDFVKSGGGIADLFQ